MAIKEEIQKEGDLEIVLRYLNGENYPPAVIVKENEEIKITWNFIYDHHNQTYYAEGRGPQKWDEEKQEIVQFRKDKYLGRDRKKAMGLYNSLLAHKKNA